MLLICCNIISRMKFDITCCLYYNVVWKKSSERELFIVMNQRGGNAVDIQMESYYLHVF